MHNICNLKGIVLKNAIAFQNGLNYDCHFFIKQLAQDFLKINLFVQKNILKNTQFYSSNKKKVARIDKKVEEVTKNISYTFKFIDSAKDYDNVIMKC